MLKDAARKKVMPKRDGESERRIVRIAQERMVSISSPEWGKPLPLVIEPNIQGVDLIAWAHHQRELVETHLLKHGAILFRGFDLGSAAAKLEQLIRALSGELLEYRYRSTPRTEFQRTES